MRRASTGGAGIPACPADPRPFGEGGRYRYRRHRAIY